MLHAIITLALGSEKRICSIVSDKDLITLFQGTWGRVDDILNL
jgi:hypothetical protein